MMRRLAALALLLFAIDARAQTVDDLFNEGYLHEVRLEIRPNEWTFLKDHFTEDIYVPCNFKWKYNGSFVDVPQIGCRNRGTGSRTPIKPGLRLQIDHYDKDRNFLGLKTIVLRNNSQDATMMHERISMAFMRRMGISAPRSTHTRLYVNNQYAGLYTIVEEVDDVFTKKWFGNGDGYLFKYDYGKDDPAHIFEYLGADPAKYVPKPFRAESHEADPKAGVIEAMIRTINQAPDATFEQTLAEYVNVRDFLYEIGVENFLAEQDGILGDYGLNNFYIYRLPTANKFNFIPWDKSNSFWAVDRNILSGVAVNILARRATSNPTLNAVFVDTVNKAIASAGASGGWMETEIARVYAMIRDAAREDTNKVCDPGASGTLRPCSNQQFEDEVTAMLNFARNRGATVTRQLSGRPILTTSPEYSYTELGATSFTPLDVFSRAASAYVRVQPLEGSSGPGVLALRQVISNGVLERETLVPGAIPIREGIFFAEQSLGTVSTEVTISNTNNVDAVLSYVLTDAQGNSAYQGTVTVAAGRQLRRELSANPFIVNQPFEGTFSFVSTVPIAVSVERNRHNGRNWIGTSIPVINRSSPSSLNILPHWADGGGWSTQFIFVNPTDTTIQFRLQFINNGTAAVPPPQVASPAGAAPPPPLLSIPPRSEFRLTTASATSNIVQSGAVRVLYDGARGPESFAITTFKVGGIAVSDATIYPSPLSTAFRMYVENDGDGLQSGIALTNTSTLSGIIKLDITDFEGRVVSSGFATVLPNTHTAFFLREVPFLAPLPASFKGVLRITSPFAAVAVMGFRGRVNERSEFLLTSVPVTSELESRSMVESVIPMVEVGLGPTSRIILYSGTPGSGSRGAIQIVRDDGSVIELRYIP